MARIRDHGREGEVRNQPSTKRVKKDCRSAGLGDLATLSDECILAILQQLPGVDLARLSTVSRALYCFAQHNELWKALVLEVRRLCTGEGCSETKEMSLSVETGSAGA